MMQQFVLCRNIVDDAECSVVVGADTLEELVEAAIEHAHATHAEEDTPALRERVKHSIKLSGAGV